MESGSGPRTRRDGTVRCLRARSCFERRQEGSAARRWTCANADVEVDPRGSSVPATSIETFESLIDIFPDKISNEDRCVWTPSAAVGWDERRQPSEWNRGQGVLQADVVQRGAQDLLLERLVRHTWEAHLSCGCRRERRTTRTSWMRGGLGVRSQERRCRATFLTSKAHRNAGVVQSGSIPFTSSRHKENLLRSPPNPAWLHSKVRPVSHEELARIQASSRTSGTNQFNLHHPTLVIRPQIHKRRGKENPWEEEEDQKVLKHGLQGGTVVPPFSQIDVRESLHQ